MTTTTTTTTTEALRLDVLPALTERRTSSDFGSRYIGPLPAQGSSVLVVDNQQIEGLPGPVAVHLYGWDRSLHIGNALPRARVLYSTGAVSNVFRCDWSSQFSLVCARITIELEMDIANPTYGYEPVEDVSFVFGAMIGIGAGATAGVARYTASAVELATQPGGEELQVPDFARWLRLDLVQIPGSPETFGDLVMTGAPLSEASLAQCRVALLTQDSYVVAVHWLTPALLASGLFLPSVVAKVRLLNGSGLYLHATASFELAL